MLQYHHKPILRGADPLNDLEWGGFPPPNTFRYRIPFTINNSSGSTLTNYQVMFIIYRTNGTSSGTKVYLGDSIKSDFSDIRFFSPALENLPYWIESYNSSFATVWVKFSSIPTGDSTWYLYYGNPSAPSASDGDATFLFFDDFNDNSLNTSKWTVVSGGGSAAVYEQNNRLEIYSDGTNRAYARSATSFKAPYVLEYSAKKSENVDTVCHWDGNFQGTYDTPVNGYQVAFVGWVTPNFFVINRFVQSNVYETAQVNMTLDTNWHNYSIKTSQNGISVFLDGTQILSTTDTTRTSGYIGFSARETPDAINAYYDNVRVRKWIDPEPTVSAWGAEQAV